MVNEGFVMIYHSELESSLLETTHQVLMYIVLKKYINKKNQCFPSMRTLAKECRCGVTKAKEVIKELIEKGIIEKIERNRPDGGRTSNLYTMHLIKNCKEKEPHLSATDQSVDKKGSKSCMNLHQDYNIESEDNCQAQNTFHWTDESVKKYYGYTFLCAEYPQYKVNIDNIMSILLDVLSSNDETIHIGRSTKSIEIVRDNYLKLTNQHIIYVIQKFLKQENRIKKITSYLKTMLYDAVLSMETDYDNKVAVDFGD